MPFLFASDAANFLIFAIGGRSLSSPRVSTSIATSASAPFTTILPMMCRALSHTASIAANHLLPAGQHVVEKAFQFHRHARIDQRRIGALQKPRERRQHPVGHQAFRGHVKEARLPLRGALPGRDVRCPAEPLTTAGVKTQDGNDRSQKVMQGVSVDGWMQNGESGDGAGQRGSAPRRLEASARNGGSKKNGRISWRSHCQ